ncbi:hypothetical protein JMJ35_001916 [Cladonia borealis]|uniref:Cytochrome P450 n=1 Tax=Cladonia borealis TaxID=184061 RepID=A0AA39R6P2_9LECA|nr:hypothetical protein JMJ35_001916 [Cladonia borealis]
MRTIIVSFSIASMVAYVLWKLHARRERNISTAYSNQRLVRAFDIDNAFTSKSDEYRKLFTLEARVKLSALEEADWKRIASHANAILQYGLTEQQCCLDSLVRSMSLKITLHTLFKLDPMDMDDKFIGDITSSINDLWVESKTSVEPSATTTKKLRQALARFFPNAESSGKGNTLNFILPAYEALWRVVLSASSRSAAPLPLHKERLSRVPDGGKTATDIVIADIEKCHRIHSLWGINADKFDPSRWKNLKAEAEGAFMPFGNAKFICPAKRVYGPMLIAVLVAALAKQITAEKWTLELYPAGSETGHELRGNEALIADRKTYEKMMIRKKKTLLIKS